MAGLVFSPEIGVAEALGRNPAVARVFIRSGAACVGCLLARFCALQDVMDAYALDEVAFLGSLSSAARDRSEESPQQNQEVPDEVRR